MLNCTYNKPKATHLNETEDLLGPKLTPVLFPQGPDFKKLSQLSQILADTTVCLSPCLLENYTTKSLQRECQRMLEELQDLALFCQARKVAELAGLPIDRLIINEVRRISM